MTRVVVSGSDSDSDDAPRTMVGTAPPQEQGGNRPGPASTPAPSVGLGSAGAFVEQRASSYLVLGLAPGGAAEQSKQIKVGDTLVGIDGFKIR